MKKSIFSLVAVAAIISSCNQAPDAAKAETGEKQDVAVADGATYTIDTAASSIGWLGTKPIGQHTGDFKLASGTITVDNGAVSAGSFIIDATSLRNFDLEKDPESHAKLVGHLKSDDFLNVEKYPTARFEITGVEVLQDDSTGTHKVSGNLTLRDSTKNVTFPARLVVTESEVTANANFNIDRTQWGLFYGNDQSRGDNFIRPEVNLNLDIKAKK
ncbi:MAG: YceI family protein [Chitinophagaceae bacterium]|nr:YceI family protein [Chitinophagaceae bacterium]MCW5928877.1 YceI family protein [Chitinophagaceae bacterium]